MQTYHLPSAMELAKTGELVLKGIWNRTLSTAQKVAEDYPSLKVYPDPEELVASPDIDALAIAVSRNATGELLKLANRYHKPVLVEKPPAKDYEEARMLSDLITVPTLVAFNRTFTPIFRHLQQSLPQRIDRAECNFYRRERNDLQFVLETGIHALMNFSILFGDGVLDTCEKSSSPDVPVPSWRATVLYPQAGDMKAHFDFNPHSTLSVERYFFYSGSRILRLQFNQHFAQDDEEILTISDDRRMLSVWRPESFGPLERQGYVGEYRAFIEMVQSGSVSPIDISRAAKIMLLAQQIGS
jgi:predicted dehydrogenase